MNTRDIHILPDDHPIGCSLGKGSISPFTITRFPVIDLVGWLLILFVGTQQRCIRIKSFLRINDHPQRLIIDLDGGGAIRGGIAAVRHDKGDFLHLKMHTIQCQHRFGVSGEGRHPGQTGSFQVFARDDR